MILHTIGDVKKASILALMVVLPLGAPGQETPPLHERIDLAVESGNVAAVAERAGDSEWLRRIYLDLCGTIPSAEAVRSYLADADPQKGPKLIGQLLESEESVQHLALTLDLWLMERRAEKHVPTAQWRKYLAESIGAGKPYNEIAREILAADGSEEKNRPAARFYLERAVEPHLLTRDVARLFFGKDLQCAQCHDHPNVTDYLQQDYYGLFAFYARSSLHQPDAKKPGLIAEKASGEAKFQSVFTDVKGTRKPRLPGGKEFQEPALKAGEEYKVKPNPKDKNVRAVPNFSLREQLAKLATDGSNRDFNRNIVNRMWAHMMGTGLVEPYDLLHAGNAPAHPELLDLLADEFVVMKFDLRTFLRELALTRTYARTFELPATALHEAEKVASSLGELEAGALRSKEAADSASDDYRAVRKAWEEGQKALQAELDALAAANKKRSEAVAAKKKVEEPVLKLREALKTKESKLTPVAEAAAKAMEAVKALPEDKELATAAAKFEERRKMLSAEVENERGALAGKEKEVSEVAAKLDAATAEVGAAQKQVEVKGAKIQEAEVALLAARNRYRSEKTAETYARRRAEDARELVAYAEHRNKLGPTEERFGQLNSASAGLENEAGTTAKVAEDLGEAALRSAAALERVSEDAELAKAVEVLRERSASAQKRAEVASKQFSDHLAEVEGAGVELKELQGKVEAGLESLVGRWSSSFSLGVFAPLTPEQLCNSTLRATGEWDRVREGVEAEFEKKLAEAAQKKAAPPEEKKDKKPLPKELTEADRVRYVAEQMAARLKPSYDKFIKLFGGQPGQPQAEFFATADQALFLENDGLVRGWLSPKGENLTARLSKMDDPAQLADELYLSTVARPSSEEETAKVGAYLEARKEDKALAIQELAWALISSVEFRFRH